MELEQYKNIKEKKYQITKIKKELEKTDYLTLKYFEGYITDEDYKGIKEYRQNLRDEINELEDELNELLGQVI